MRPLTILIILIITFNSCVTDKSENLDWSKCRQKNTVQDYFNFAINSTSTAYFDSAIVVLNDSIRLDKFFFLSYKEDSNLFYKEEINSSWEIAKSNMFLIDANSSNCLFYDTLITNQDSINKKLEWFMSLGFKHFVWIYSDSLSTRKSWISFFGKIKEVTNKYKSVRERYSQDNWNIKLGELDSGKIEQVKEKIPMNMLVFFQNPNPPPPKLIELQDKTNSKK